MLHQHFHTSITVPVTAQEAFDCINSVTQWWTKQVKGSSQNLHDVFSVQFGDLHYSEQKIVESIPNQKIVWLVTDSKLNFLEDKQEWTNTTICFELSDQDNHTIIDFTHRGLAPHIECYGACSKAWDHYIKGSLFKLITEGKGSPELK